MLVVVVIIDALNVVLYDVMEMIVQAISLSLVFLVKEDVVLADLRNMRQCLGLFLQR